MAELGHDGGDIMRQLHQGESFAVRRTASHLAAEGYSSVRGLIDIAVVTALDHIDAERLPAKLAISALIVGELGKGWSSAYPDKRPSVIERGRRREISIRPIRRPPRV